MNRDDWKVQEIVGVGILGAEAGAKAAKFIEEKIVELLGTPAKILGINRNGDKIDVDMVITPIHPLNHVTVDIAVEPEPQKTMIQEGYGISIDDIVQSQPMLGPSSIMWGFVQTPADKNAIVQEIRTIKITIPKDRWDQIIEEIEDDK